jgi:hypothetical protein
MSVLVGAASCGVALAQEDPIVIGDVRRPKTVQFERPKAVLGFLSLYAHDETTTAGETTEVEELRFEESLTLSTTGHLIHPNLIEFPKLEGTFGLSQSDFEVNGQGSRADSEIYEFDTRARFLRLEPTNYSIYARRNRDLVNRDFGISLENTTTTYGALVESRIGNLNNRLDVFHTDSEQFALDDSSDFTVDQDTILWNGWYNIDVQQRLRWEYTFQSIRQSSEVFNVDTSYDTHDAEVEHIYTFGPRNLSELNSIVRFFSQTGDFSFDRLTLEERLRLQHSDTFRTEYLYRLENQTRDEFDQLQHRAEAGFTHHLYRSLITRGRVGGTLLDTSDDAGTNEIFGTLDTQYTKTVPLGVLRLDLGLNAAQQETEGGGFISQVIDQNVSFVDPNPIVIFGNDVQVQSITNPVGILYIPGEDYRVRRFANRVEIDRIPTGAILPSQPVLIDYTLGPEADHTTTTSGFSFGGNYTFEQGPLRGVSLFARYAMQEQEIDPAEATVVAPNDFTDTLFGVEYRVRSLTLRAEREEFDSTLLPFEATRFTARLLHTLGPVTTVNGDVTYSLIDYSDPDNSVELLTASAQVRHRFSRELEGRAYVLWRDQSDDFGGSATGFEQQVELRWKHRQTEVFMELRNATFDGETLDTDFQLFQIGIRREF